MWPFRRKKSNVAPEIESYYRAERRERMGVAWLVGLVTLVVTILIAAGLFFGGRWVYRSLKNDDGNKTATTQTETDQSNDTGGQVTPDGASTTTPSQTPAPQPSTTPTPTPTPAPSPTTNTPTPAQVAANNTSNPLPSTGGGSLLGIFAVTTLVSTIAHRFLMRKDPIRN